MEAKESVVVSFKELVGEKAYDKITVSEICERAGVSRKSFYADFQDKEAIVEHIFNQQVIEPLRDLHRLLSREDCLRMENRFNERMYRCVYEDREFYMNLVSPFPGNDDPFARAVIKGIYEFNITHLPTISRLATGWQLEYVSYFFASSQAMYMRKWIRDGMKVTPQELSQLHAAMTMPFWKSMASGGLPQYEGQTA